MLHMVPTVEQLKHEGYHGAVQELKAEGKVRFTGLSTHGTEHKLSGPVKDEMDRIILAAAEDGRFDVVLFTYNFIQREMGDRILAACKSRNMGTTLMKTNPIKFYQDLQDIESRNREQGRKLGEQFYKIMADYKALVDRRADFIREYGLTSPERARDAAIQFCLGNPDVHSVCPSMNSFDELRSFVSLSGTRLNTVMLYYHYFSAQRREKYAMEKYRDLRGNDAAVCATCSVCECETLCPYGVPVQAMLLLAHQAPSLGDGFYSADHRQVA